MKSRLLPPRRHGLRGISRAERNRRLTSLGLSRLEDEAIQREALAIVERFRRWTGQQPCVVTGWRSGETHTWEGGRYLVGVEWAHVTGKRGSWCADFGVTVPLLDLLHRQQEDDPEFFARHGLDVVQLAARSAIAFFAEHPQDAAWILEHAVDGDVIALARAGLEER